MCSHADREVEHAWQWDTTSGRMICASHPPTPRDLGTLASDIATWQQEA